MKKVIILFFALISVASITYSQNISFPINRAVFQRSSNAASATSTVTFAGQFTENASGSGTTNNSTYEIRRLRIDGVDLGAHTAPTSFSAGQKTRIGSSLGYTYYFNLNVPTGWYQFNLKNGSNNVVQSIKFGVGEVFVIAGQSNAQGFGATGFGYTVVENYDCVNSLKNVEQVWPVGGGVGEVLDYVNLERPSFGPLKYSNIIADPGHNNPWIGPNGTRTWYYLWLGERLAKMHSASPLTTTNANYSTQPPVPMMFYNVAVAGTSINNWEGAMKKTKGFFNFNYTNNLNSSADPNSIDGNPAYPSQTPWTANPNYDKLFTVFKNVLSFYGGMFGVRTVIWHQGEAETKTLSNIHKSGIYEAQGTVPSSYSVNNYETKLKAIIDESREILPELKWTIFRASLIGEQEKSTGIYYENIVNDYHRSGFSGQSWLYTSPYAAVSPITPVLIGSNNEANVIKQQELLQTNYSSYISLAGNTDDYHSSGYNYRQADKTHFNGSALWAIGYSLFQTSPSSDALTKAPVSPIPIPKPVITGSSGSYMVNLLAPTGVSYVSRQWHTSTSSRFNQAATNSISDFTMNYGNGSFTGYTKDTKGRISIIPYAQITGVSGARLANEPSKMTVYPNPILSQDLNVEYDVSEASLEDLLLEVVTESGKILYSETLKSTKSGKNTWTVKRNLLGQTNDFDFLYVRIIDGDKVTSKKVVIHH